MRVESGCGKNLEVSHRDIHVDSKRRKEETRTWMVELDPLVSDHMRLVGTHLGSDECEIQPWQSDSDIHLSFMPLRLTSPHCM